MSPVSALRESDMQIFQAVQNVSYIESGVGYWSVCPSVERRLLAGEPREARPDKELPRQHTLPLVTPILQ